MAEQNSPLAMVIHGGAGVILEKNMSAEVEASYRRKLEESVRAGYDILSAGGSSTKAVIKAITILEDSELFNAGKGGVFTHQGKVELDASIMRGSDLEAGAVAGIKRVKNPIELANEVMTSSSHVMLMGEGAEDFAKENGYTLIDNSYFHTERRRRQLEKRLQSEKVGALSGDVPSGGVSSGDVLSEEDDDEFDIDNNKYGTVGAVAIDQQGNIAAGTSTGGMTNKKFGRIGDSPIIGAGTYADNRSCGISATGHGEFFIRAVVAHDICARVLYKKISLASAADEVVQQRLVSMGGGGGVIGIDPNANIIFSFNTPGMYRASVDKTGKLTVAIFKKE